MNLKEHDFGDMDTDPTIKYVIRRHFSANNMRQLTLSDLDELAELSRKPEVSVDMDSDIEERLVMDKEVNTDEYDDDLSKEADVKL